MKSRILRLGVVFVFVALACLGIWRLQWHTASTTFAGPDFHTPDEKDVNAVFSDVCTHLEAAGFHRTNSPSAMDSWAGIHPAGETVQWFGRQESKNSGLWISVSQTTGAVFTSIKWQNHGTPSSNRHANERAYEFALDFDTWMKARPQTNEMPSELIERKTAAFRTALADLSVR